LVAGAAAILAAAPAAAHAVLRSSDPARGATLDAAPKQVSLTFTEQPDSALSIVRVLNSSGGEVQRGRAKPVPADRLTLAIALREGLGDGVYTVSWRVVSRVDGHLTAGSFSFGVGEAPKIVPGEERATETPAPTPLSVAGRWALYAGLALLVGYAVAGTFVLGAGALRGRTAVIVAWGLAAIGYAVMVEEQARAVGISTAKLLSSDTGAGPVRLAIALGVAGALAVAVAVFGQRRALLAALGLAASASMLARVASGHAGGAESWAWLKVTEQWVHFTAAGVWAGALFWLLRGLAGRSEFDRAGAVRRFSSVALVAILVAGATGSLRALTEVGALGRLTSTGYGRAVLIKIVLFCGILGLGALNRFSLVPRLDERWRSLRRSVTIEIAIAATVFGVTGTMAGLAPPALAGAATARKAPDRIVVSGADFATTVRVRLTVAPGTAGPNLFRAEVTDYDTGAPVDAQSVQLRLTLPSRPEAGMQLVQLLHAKGALWTAESTALSIDGRWRVVVRVQMATRTAEVTLRLDTRLPEQDITVAREKGQPTLYTVKLAGGRSVQAYLDPGEKAGANDVHFTFFDEKGNEFPVASATMEAAPPEGDGFALTVRRFGPGHFVASASLTRGTWLFRVVANAGGETLSAYFRQAIP
jgi:copper transport protein